MAAGTHNGVNYRAFMSTTERGSANRPLARWGIVLAGGDGKRMLPLVRSWLGEDRPKQYCTFVGSRSMFRHTVDRARAVVSGEHVVTVLGRGHRKFLAASTDEHIPGVVLEQPTNLGTAPGVFLPTAYVLAHNPDATIVLFPSDHFVYPEERFCAHVIHAFELAEKHHDQIILAAAIPDRAETEYGWIEPSRIPGDRNEAPADGLMKVMRFREKPNVQEARALLRQGCLWNTMVMTVKAKTLWSLGWQCLPEMMYQFHAFLMVLRAVREERLESSYEASALAAIYDDLVPADFSLDILQRVFDQSIVLPMDGVKWCDWGRPRRVTEALASLGRRPVFAPDCLAKGLESAGVANESQK